MNRTLFIDQSGELGGAELCLGDFLTARSNRFDDRVLLFSEGPFVAILKENGIDVEVLLMSDRLSSIRRESSFVSQLRSLKELNAKTRYLRQQLDEFDVVYANTAKALVLAALTIRTTSKRLVYHLHDIITADHFSRVNRLLLVALANRYASRVIANSYATADAFIEAGGKKRLIEVIYNGFDPDSYRKAINNRSEVNAAVRTSLGISESTPLVAVFGRLARWKGQHIAIKAVAECPGVHLLIVGDAIFGEQDYANSLRALAYDLKLSDRVHFLGFRRDIDDLMQCADCVVHCSIAPEPFGRVIVEAMLSQRPVIASNTGGASEIIEHKRTGILHEMNSVKSLIAALQAVLTDPARAQQLAKAARDDASKRFCLADKVTETNDVIQQVVESKQTSFS